MFGCLAEQRKLNKEHRKLISPMDKKSFPLRISPALFEELKRWADQEMRSVNGQIEYLLREAVHQRLKPKSPPSTTTPDPTTPQSFDPLTDPDIPAP